MKKMRWGEIIKRNRELGLSMSGPVKRIALISNSTIFQLKDILELELRELGMAIEIDLGDYDSILRDSERFGKHDAVIIFWELSNLLDGFNYKYNLFSDEKLDSLMNKVESEIQLTLENLKEIPLVLLNRFSSMPYDSDVLTDSRLRAVAERLNNSVKNMASQNQLIVDIEKIIAITGLEQSLDYRQFQSSKSLYTKAFYFNYVDQVKSAFLASNGIVKKVLVLDCDNTLGGGVLGEDGEENLEMSDLTANGRSFHEVQHLVKSLELQGVLLALCSKNNLADVDRVLESHPHMILKDRDFVAKKVNWTDKAKNLIELSNELNLGLDSFVFVDDSEFEVGLIQRELPQVRAILVPENISDYPSVIRSLEREFFSFSVTEEDSHKTSMYIQENKRVETEKSFESIDEYLSSLGLIINVFFDNDVSIARAAQLTQKTNQFNLRTCRYSESEINNFIGSTDHLVAAFSLADMYGDYGIAGLSILALEEKSAFFDTFLMSCRVIGRNVEYSFFTQIINELKKIKVNEISIEAEWISTPKNQQVENFYDNLGFSFTIEVGNAKCYRLLPSAYVAKDKDYIQISK